MSTLKTKSINKINRKLLVIKNKVNNLTSEIEPIMHEWDRMEEKYRLKTYDIVLDLLKNLITVVAAIFVGTFAISVDPQAKSLSGVSLSVLVIVLVIALFFRFRSTESIYKRNEAWLQSKLRRLAGPLENIEKEVDTLKVNLDKIKK